MNVLKTLGIVLARVNFGEADRILTIITPHMGKIRLIAKGSRKIKSKMAGGIELFSINELSYIKGKGEISTLVSSRLISHYSEIVKDINKTMLGYEIIKIINKTTEDNSGEEFYELLEASLSALNDKSLEIDIFKLWFYAQLLKISGNTPNMLNGADGKKLLEDKKYYFSHEEMVFYEHPSGTFTKNHIKFMRLTFSSAKPGSIQQIENTTKLIKPVLSLYEIIAPNHIKV